MSQAWPQVWIVCQVNWAHDILVWHMKWPLLSKNISGEIENLQAPVGTPDRSPIHKKEWEPSPKTLSVFCWFTINAGFPHHITRILHRNWGNTITPHQSFLLSRCWQSREAGQGLVSREVSNSRKPSVWRGLQRSFSHPTKSLQQIFNIQRITLIEGREIATTTPFSPLKKRFGRMEKK